MKICVYGAASDKIDKSFIEAVEYLGEEMARRGHSLVFGAGASGLMGAAARGVHKGGGKVFGVIPTFFKEQTIEVIYKECDEIVFTETMAQRKSKMEDEADAFIIVPGGIGTFEEFFQVLTLKQLGRHTKPIVIFDVNNYYEKLEAFMDTAVEKGFLNADCKLLYGYSKYAEEVIDYIENDKRKEKNVHDLKN